MSGEINIEIDEKKLKELVLDYISDIMNVDIDEKDIFIVVKSKQNYRSEWEHAAFKATICKRI